MPVLSVVVFFTSRSGPRVTITVATSALPESLVTRPRTTSAVACAEAERAEIKKRRAVANRRMTDMFSLRKSEQRSNRTTGLIADRAFRFAVFAVPLFSGKSTIQTQLVHVRLTLRPGSAP